jgi:hypothetical protein
VPLDHRPAGPGPRRATLDRSSGVGDRPRHGRFGHHRVRARTSDGPTRPRVGSGTPRRWSRAPRGRSRPVGRWSSARRGPRGPVRGRSGLREAGRARPLRVARGCRGDGALDRPPVRDDFGPCPGPIDPRGARLDSQPMSGPDRRDDSPVDRREAGRREEDRRPSASMAGLEAKERARIRPRTAAVPHCRSGRDAPVGPTLNTLTVSRLGSRKQA